MSAKNTLNKEPFLEIIEQPGQSYYRNESEIEKEKHGGIQGVSNGKTVPTIKVNNAKGKMTLKVTPLNAENGQLHFTRLARQDRKAMSEEILDPCSFELTEKNSYTEKLKLAIMIPGKNSEFLRPGTDKNLGKIVLNFELFDENGNKVNEIQSDPFGNKRNKLEIKKMSEQEGSASGGLNIWIICSRVQLKNCDIEVRFSKDNWEKYVKVDEAYNQDVLIIQSPPYCNQNITEPTTVNVQLKNQIDGSLSEKFQFTYQPGRQAIKRCASPIDSCDKENDSYCAISSNKVLSEFLQPKRIRIEDSKSTEKNLYLNNPAQVVEYNVVEYNDNSNGNNNFNDININFNGSNNSNNNSIIDNNNYKNNGECVSQEDSTYSLDEVLDHLYNSDYPPIVNDIDGQFLSSIAEVLEKTIPQSFLQTDERFPTGITEDYLLSDQFVVNGFPSVQIVPFENY